MRVLLTSFEPFGGMDRNSSHETALELVKQPPDGVELDWLCLPVVALACVERAWGRWLEQRHDGILSLGQSGLAPCIHLEDRGINYDDFRFPDNGGNVRRGPVIEGAADHLRTSLPLERIIGELRSSGVNVEPSFSAGSYVCNHHYYHLLHRATQTERPPWVLFVHLPLVPGQGAPCAPAAVLAEGLRRLLLCV